MEQASVDKDEKAQLESALQLAKSFGNEVEHNQQVVNLALKIFDGLKPLHELGDQERFWLHNAAILHDIGLVDGPKGHHKASLRHILEDPLEFNEHERLIIGSIARYHRATLPRKKHSHYNSLDKSERRAVSVLAGILRVADGLDRTHLGIIKDISCEVDKNRITVKCSVNRPSEIDREAATDKGDLMKKVFKRKLDIEWIIKQ